MTHCILAMPLVVVLAALPLAAQRTPDTRISTTPAGGQNLLHPRVVATGDSVYVVWQNASLGAIHATRSLDRGATWLLADQRLDVGLTAGDSVAPDLCANGAAVYVAWEEHRASAANGDIWCVNQNRFL